MKIGFFLAHPGHFHLFKNVIQKISEKHEVLVLYNQKDVLEDLINTSEIGHLCKKIKTNTNVKGKLSLIWQFVLKNWGAYREFRKFRPKVVYGTPVLIAIIGKLLKYDSVIVNEDDFDIIEKTAKLGYPKATHIVCPKVCRTGIYDDKCIKHNSYHELAYLHPNHFSPDRTVVNKYISEGQNYGLLRFAKLSAHHDEGIKGINDEIALKLIELMKPSMKVVITSERPLSKELEPYRLAVSPRHMHQFIAHADLYLGDSQTMAAEAAVLGTPFIRFNDFVGRISYLDELENEYGLGYGIKPENEHDLYQKLSEILTTNDLKQQWELKQARLLDDKIDLSDFLFELINDYPASVPILKNHKSKSA